MVEIFIKESEGLIRENPCLKFSYINIVRLSAFSFCKASYSTEECTLWKESLSVVLCPGFILQCWWKRLLVVICQAMLSALPWVQCKRFFNLLRKNQLNIAQTNDLNCATQVVLPQTRCLAHANLFQLVYGRNYFFVCLSEGKNKGEGGNAFICVFRFNLWWWH